VSVFAIHELLYRAVHDVPFRDALVADPAGTLQTLDLTDDERRALLDRDVGRLYRWGVNTYMMGHLMRYKLFGIERDHYSKSIWAAARAAGQPAGGP
jgi:hypothetical protein